MSTSATDTLDCRPRYCHRRTFACQGCLLPCHQTPAASSVDEDPPKMYTGAHVCYTWRRYSSDPRSSHTCSFSSDKHHKDALCVLEWFWWLPFGLASIRRTSSRSIVEGMELGVALKRTLLAIVADEKQLLQPCWSGECVDRGSRILCAWDERMLWGKRLLSTRGVVFAVRRTRCDCP